jgi:phage terminase large subunit-like protein
VRNWDAESATSVIRFFEQYLVYVDGPDEGKPIKLREWQAEPLRKVFGTLAPDGDRQYLTWFMQMNKKQGKTEIMAAGLALYRLTIDGERGARVIAGATARDQAAEIYKPAAKMIKLSRGLQDLGFDPAIDLHDSTKTIIYRPNDATFQAVAAEAGPLHGKKPSTLIFDEIHAMRDRLMIDALREGMGTWKQPLTLYITNMGEIGGSPVFWEEFEYAKKCRDNPDFDPSYLSVIYEADPRMSDDELLEEGPHWYSLNPGLGDFMSLTDIRRACREAKEKPQQRSRVLRFRLGRATQPVSAWIPIAKWRACKQDFDERDLWGRRCFAGLDLSSKWDFSATGLVFPEPDGGATLHCYGYVPEGRIEAIERVTGRPIRAWVDQGLILATPGDRIKLDFIEDHVKELAKRFEIDSLAYDPAFAEQLTEHLEEHGIERVEFPQTTPYFNEPCMEFEAQVGNGKIRHNGNPVLDYCIESLAIKTDDRERIKPVKIRERRIDTRRIDLAVAALMGFALRIRGLKKKPPIDLSQAMFG